MNRQKGISLIKVVMGIAVLTCAAMMFASWILAPIQSQSADRYKMTKRPEYATLARDVAPTNGFVVSVTGIVTAKYDTEGATIVVLGEDPAVPCYFDKWSRDLKNISPGRVVTVKGITKTEVGTTWLRMAETHINTTLERQLMAEIQAGKEAQNVKPETSTRNVARTRQQQLWNQANRPGQRNGPTYRRRVTQ